MSDTLSIRGMPKGNREVAAAIAAAGDALVMTEDGRYASRRDVVANAVWEVLLTGELTLSDGSAVRVDSISEWFSILKWVGAHLDGPPVTLADARSTNMVVRVVYDEEPPYPEDAAPLAGAAVYENGS